MMLISALVYGFGGIDCDLNIGFETDVDADVGMNSDGDTGVG